VGTFGGDNRAGVQGTLHRISAIRNRKGTIVGLTCRVGRAVTGHIDMIRDMLEGKKLPCCCLSVQKQGSIYCAAFYCTALHDVLHTDLLHVTTQDWPSQVGCTVQKGMKQHEHCRKSEHP